MCGKDLSKAEYDNLSCRGGLLIELLLGITLIMIGLSAFMMFLGESLHWAQRFHIRNEILFENMTGRQVLTYALLNTNKPISVFYNGNYIMWDDARRYGVEYGEIRRVLDNGQKQALTATTVSPDWGSLIVKSDGYGPIFHQTEKDGPIHMKWQMYVKGRATKGGDSYVERTELTIYPLFTYFTYPQNHEADEGDQVFE
ncbi:MAG: hypothetical protein KHZ77_06925 [Veillonella sp.]|uniref:hypothetical protein n=1 Tax=Veillonella sp. TaxID=1926307 RepID=UPI0025F47F5B|nr:hypothetical protein [Veillonella sp.]MBS4913884.1 hypothetical protein [Veillonella sp.]